MLGQGAERRDRCAALGLLRLHRQLLVSRFLLPRPRDRPGDSSNAVMRLDAREDPSGAIVRVGLTEAHGMAAEAAQFAPPGVQYSFLKPLPASWSPIRSPIKGFMRRYETGGQDLIEA